MIYIFVSDEQLMLLNRDLNTSTRSAFARGTLKNLKIQWETFLLFCMFFKLNYVSVSTKVLSLYAQFLSRSFKSVESIKNYLSGVKTMHYILGYTTVNINDFMLSLCIKGISRLNPYCVKQAKPITPNILIRMYSLLNFSKLIDTVYWCLFLFAFFLFARKSNLVPNSASDSKEGKYLLHRNVYFKGEILIVEMLWTKTIQFGERKLLTPLIPINGSILCPILAYKSMCEKVKVKGDAPLFSLSSTKFITYNSYQRKLKELISKLNLDPSEYSSHSFRRGGASFAFESGVSADLIQHHGDWKSDAYKRYLAFSLQDKVKVAEKMRDNIIL